MWKRNQPQPEIEAQVTVRTEPGITPYVARRLVACANRLTCQAQLRSASGRTADARQLLELLVLGVRAGDRVSLRCVGHDAQAGWRALASILDTPEPT
jgi:phosphotransferase system HPr (HPr) family protein